MKITFIKPNIGRREHSLYVDQGRMEPLMLGVLAALTPSGIEVALYDDRMESIPYDEPTDLVAITVESFTARRSYEIAREYRNRDVKVILGGIHPTLLPEEAVMHADAIVTGDAETVWRTVLHDACAGALQKRYNALPGVGQAGKVLPCRDLFRNKGYLPVSLMQFSRGCRFACSYCAVSRYFGGQHYLREIEDVILEISSQDRKIVFFVDDNIASDRVALKMLCRELVPLKIKWFSQASLDITEDRELMRLMAESGCVGNVIGFESLNPASLRESKKLHNLESCSDYHAATEILRDYGMMTWAAFTLGYDDDTLVSIKATVEFALKNHFSFAAFNILMPYPSTPFYDRLKKEKRLLYDGAWWLHPEYRFNYAAFVPKKMTPDELTQACFNARKQFNSLPSLLYRFLDVKTSLRTFWSVVTYWRYSVLFRKEVFKKHGMKFGLK